jgi:hypothetical protein
MRVFGLAMLLCLCAGPAMARLGHASGEGQQSGSESPEVQGQNSPRPDWLDVNVVSGVEERVGEACSWGWGRPGDVPYVTMIENPTHGTIEIRDVSDGSPCGDGPMKGVFYTSEPGYKGPDRVGYRINIGRRSILSFTKDIMVK